MIGKNENPPSWADRFLEWFCPEEILEIIQGDLYELYEKRKKKLGSRQARWFFLLDVFSIFRSFAFRKKYSTINYMGLIKHSFLLFVRTSRKYKSSFFINLIGLSTGLTAAFLIFLWINHEWSINKGFAKDDQTYVILENYDHNGALETSDFTPLPLAEELVTNYPEVENAVAVLPGDWRGSKGILTANTQSVKGNPAYTTMAFFNIFPYPIIAGEQQNILLDKNAIWISRSMAEKLFNTPDAAIDQQVSWSYPGGLGGEFYVAGVYDLPTVQLTQTVDVALSLDIFLDARPNNKEWFNSNIQTYAVLKSNADVAAFNDKIKDIPASKHDRSKSQLYAQAYSDQYLYSRYENGVPVGGRIDYVYLFSFVAIAILLIACINFMNLSTARASRRMKEIGVKKALGAQREAIVIQCLGESFFMTLTAALSAILLIYLLLPGFKAFTNKALVVNLGLSQILIIVGGLILTAFLAGSYPALYLSGLRPISTLKGKINKWSGELWTRQGLVVFQFTISVILIVGVLVIYNQIELVQSQNLGYDRSQIITFSNEGPLAEKSEAFRQELKNISGVEHASMMYGSILGGFGSTSSINWEGKTEDFSMSNQEVGYDFFETMGIEIIEGRGFSKAFGSDRKKLVLNEAAVQLMGFDEPVGSQITLWNDSWEIIGVAKNFHFESLYNDLKPCFLRLTESASTFLVKIEDASNSATLNQIDEVYQRYNPGLPFGYQFLDESYQRFYESELRVANLSWFFAMIAIIISCLGLFGLSAFTAERKVKEIGIRKILGSSNWEIMVLLSSSFGKMILFSIVIGLPISYWLAQGWLNGFAYRIDLEWWYFVLAGFASLFIALLTVSFQTLRAASQSPLKGLQTE